MLGRFSPQFQYSSRFVRVLSTLTGAAYPFWQLLVPSGLTSPASLWWLIGAGFLAVGLLPERVGIVARYRAVAFYVCFAATATHCLVLAQINGMHPFFAIGAFFAVMMQSLAIRGRRPLIVYAGYIVLLTGSLFALSPSNLKVAYWGTLWMALAFAYARLSGELAAAEIAGRYQAELEDRVRDRTAELRVREEKLAATVDQLHKEMAAREKLEDRLLLSQKLEALGRLAGGVAHDYNNLLTIIRGYSEMLIEALPEGSPGRSDAREIERATQHAADLTQQLLSFSREKAIEKRVFDLDAVVRRNLGVLRSVLGEDKDLRVRLLQREIPIEANVSQVEQVLLNLVVNARDATDPGGCVCIATGLPARDALPDDVPEGDYALLEVTDDGHGMDAPTRARIFDPYFTTKGVDRGMGLGLSIAYGIVEQAGGILRVESEPGAGARFEIYWPRSPRPIQGEGAERAPLPEPEASRSGARRILLVEDQQAIRALIGRVLTRQGYEVLAAPDAESALAIATADPGVIDVVVSDVVMPNMSGTELVARLALTRPSMKLLLISGHQDHPSLERHSLPPGCIVLAKPFPPSELTARIRALLDGPTD